MNNTPIQTRFNVLDYGFVTYIDHMGSDHDICEAARISYSRRDREFDPVKDLNLIFRLFRDRHTSPFEMGKIVFNIKMPIFVMRQFVRHRMQNLNEVSARYTELPNEFYIPEKWRLQDPKNRQGSDGFADDHATSLCVNRTREICEKAYEIYEIMLKNGISREMARMVLPVNIYTEIVCCWDMNNLLKFFSLRDDVHAQAEIQEYAKAMKAIAATVFPHVMEAYENKGVLPEVVS